MFHALIEERAGKESLLSISRAWILNEMVWYGSAAICASITVYSDQRLDRYVKFLRAGP